MVANKASIDGVALQAIIVADSFTTELEPITLECPKALLPLVNTPMIDYTLAWLESSNVEQVFVLCCSHSKQIINHLDKVKKPKFSVTTIESHNCTSGLRVIYERNVIQGDFILVSGDTVSNIMLTQALEEHKDRKQKDKNAVMTMIIKQSEPCDDKLIVAIDPTTKELLYYEDKADDLKFDKSFLTVNPCLSLHNDKQDCYIHICSPQFLSLFTDNNFDYQHLRGDFVKGLLADGNFKIFTHEIHSSFYVARIDNFRSYDSISKDIIIQRLSINIPSPAKSQVIGSFTCIGNNTIISNSVVGDGCKIGSNVAIDGCYIWNNVTIQDGCKLRHAILCDGVVMKSGAVLEPGVVLSYKVVVGQEFVVPSHSKVSLLVKQDSDKENIRVVTDMGEDGRGVIWSMSEVDHEEERIPIPESRDRIFEKKLEKYFLWAVHVNMGIHHILYEVNLIRRSCRMPITRCVDVLLYLIMKLALDISNTSGNDLVKETNDVISKWGDLLKSFSPRTHQQIQVILKFEEMCLEFAKEYAPFFVQLLYIFYDKDIIQKEAILNWANNREHAHESDKVFVKQSENFIQSLKQEDQEFQGH